MKEKEEKWLEFINANKESYFESVGQNEKRVKTFNGWSVQKQYLHLKRFLKIKTKRRFSPFSFGSLPRLICGSFENSFLMIWARDFDSSFVLKITGILCVPARGMSGRPTRCTTSAKWRVERPNRNADSWPSPSPT